MTWLVSLLLTIFDDEGGPLHTMWSDVKGSFIHTQL